MIVFDFFPRANIWMGNEKGDIIALVKMKQDLTDLGKIGLPPDFPVPADFLDGHYLKCYGCVAN